MKDYKLTREEQETIILFNAKDNMASVSSLDPVWQRKIQKIKGSQKVGAYWEVNIPKKLISIRQERTLTPEQKAKLSARMKSVRKRQVITSSKKAKR